MTGNGTTPPRVNDTLRTLQHVRQTYSQRELAERLHVDQRTVRRWESGDSRPPSYLLPALAHLLPPKARPAVPEFKFVDLFAGIGGLRMAFNSVGGDCVFTSEWDALCAKTYKANFGDADVHGDITKIWEGDVPDHDVLLAGFPCQPFSIAGVSKKNSLGRAHGFLCEAQGTLFFDLARIIQAKKPWAFLLENVKHLLSHDRGNTFRVIRRVLEKKLGYELHFKVIDARKFVPQHRERLYMVGFRGNTSFSWEALKFPASSPTLKDVLHPQDGNEPAEPPYTEGSKAKVAQKYVLTEHLWNYLQKYAAKHKAKGNGFGFGLFDRNDVARTLSARYFKDGSEILISRGNGRIPRRLTPRECARLMGFDSPEHQFVIPVSDTQAYKQFGNSIVVPLVREIARVMKPHILELKNAAGREAQLLLIA
jgi:DNA (cytosine-5)-methyltransferase 1